MRLRQALWWLVALLSISASAAFAQTSQPASDHQRLEQFEQRLTQVEQKYQADLKARDEEIARLKDQLSKQPATQSSTMPLDEIEKTRQEVLKDINSREAQPLTLRTPANFNPDLAVIGDFKGNVSTDNANPARNRADLGTLELELRAAVDPRADAVAVLPVARDVEDPLFFDPATATGDVETDIEIEEAYILLHDFGVPNLIAKVGRFHLRFGRQNILHNHDWPTSDNNFVNQSFLGPEAVTDNGVSLSYVIPPKLVAGQYFEIIEEVITGEGDAENPVLNNDAFVDSPGNNLHVLWNHDVARDWNLEVGSSWLWGKHNNDNQQNANLFGVDLTLIHVDPTGGFFNQLLQAEAIYGIVDTSQVNTEDSFGVYLLAQQQLNRDWYSGVRLDWTENALDHTQEVWGVSPYLSWYWSEFLRFRTEYQHKAGDVPSEDTLYFQVTWVFGASAASVLVNEVEKESKMKWFLITLLTACGLANGQIKIVTTATDYADIAKQIGDGKVTVHSVMKGPENVHNVMAKPTEMVFLNQADLFVHSGLDTEPWRDNLLRGARNPKIAVGKPGWVDMSNGIELKEVPAGKIDRSQGDVHAFGNPHFTLNPQIAQKMTVTLVKAMIAVDSTNADLYRANAERFVNEMTDLSREIRKTFAPYAGLRVVTFHAAWEYFADAVPIEIVGTIEPKPAITPSPAQVQQTIQLMKDQAVKVVICETYDDPKLAGYIAEKAGAKMVVLPDHVLGVPQADTYQNLFRYNVQKLIETAQAAGIAPKTEVGSADAR